MTLTTTCMHKESIWGGISMLSIISILMICVLWTPSEYFLNYFSEVLIRTYDVVNIYITWGQWMICHAIRMHFANCGNCQLKSSVNGIYCKQSGGRERRSAYCKPGFPVCTLKGDMKVPSPWVITTAHRPTPGGFVVICGTRPVFAEQAYLDQISHYNGQKRTQSLPVAPFPGTCLRWKDLLKHIDAAWQKAS